MKVRDFAAELISEIADELGYLVFKYECSSSSCGNIVFELEVSEEGTEEVAKKYKILDYSGYEITLTNPADRDLANPFLGRQTIDLHRPESVQDLREWFEDLEKSFDSPLGAGMFGGYSTWPARPGSAGIITSTPGSSLIIGSATTTGTGVIVGGGSISITTPTSITPAHPLWISGTTASPPNNNGITIGSTQLSSTIGYSSVSSTNANQVFGSVNPSFGTLSFGGP